MFEGDDIVTGAQAVKAPRPPALDWDRGLELLVEFWSRRAFRF
jgi:hypothetical protein